jgi:hypothetical protein
LIGGDVLRVAGRGGKKTGKRQKLHAHGVARCGCDVLFLTSGSGMSYFPHSKTGVKRRPSMVFISFKTSC